MLVFYSWTRGIEEAYCTEGRRRDWVLEELVFMAIHHPSQYPTWYSILSPWLACREHNEVFFNAPRPFQSLIAAAGLRMLIPYGCTMRPRLCAAADTFNFRHGKIWPNKRQSQSCQPYTTPSKALNTLEFDAFWRINPKTVFFSGG